MLYEICYPISESCFVTYAYACTCRSFISMILQNMPTTHCLSHIRNPRCYLYVNYFACSQKKKNTKTKKKTTQNHRTTGVVSPLVNIHERAYKNFIIGSPVVNYRLWYPCLFMTPPLFASAIFNLRFPFLLFIITTWPWRYCWFAKNSVKWLQLFIE